MLIKMKRRNLLKSLAAVPAFALPLQMLRAQELGLRRGPLKMSVMPQVWNGTDFSFEERCEILQMLGFAGMDLPTPDQVPVLREYDLEPAMMTGTGTGFADGLIRPEIHDQIEEATLAGIDMCAELGCRHLIALPGQRRGMSREEGADNAVDILSRVAPHAEEKDVMLSMEITNSKVESDNRTDQVFDDIHWGFDVCRRTGSSHVKVVYDFYHVQIANGDVVRTMRDNLDLIAHMHVAGVPTRGIIDRHQELNYPFIARAIAETGFDGFVALEHIPREDTNPLISLAVGYDIMTSATE